MASESRNLAQQRREKDGIVYFERGILTGRDGRRYQRYAIQTHFVEVGESAAELVKKYVLPLAQPGDVLSITAKVMAMCTGNVRRMEDMGARAENIRAAAEGIHLPLLIYAAENDGRVDGQLFAIKHEIIINLLGEFAGRGEDEGADGAALPEAGGLFCQLLDNRQGERGSFARASLRTAQHILSSEDERDGRLLNRSRGFITCRLHILQEQGHQFQVIKTHSDSSNLFNLWRKQNAPNAIISQFRG